MCIVCSLVDSSLGLNQEQSLYIGHWKCASVIFEGSVLLL